MYPFNHKMGQKIQSDASSVAVDRGFLAHLQISAENAIAASNNAVHAAVTDTGAQQVVTTGITNPAVPRNITATAGGTAANITAVSVIIEGTNFNDEVITETLPAFTAATAGTKAGTKAFKTVTKITIPACGTGVTIAIGFGEVLGLPYKLTRNTVLAAYVDNAKEGTAPTVVVSATALESNTIDLNTALSGKVVDIDLIV